MELTQLQLFMRLGVALATGLLVGLQREYAKGRDGEDDDFFAGARTFTLLSITGAAAAYLSQQFATNLVLVAALVAVGVMIAVAYLAGARDGETGLTTEVAAFLTVITGALCIVGDLAVAAAVAVTSTVLLALKLQTQTLAEKLTREDIMATLKFAVISVIILPILPREGFGSPPFDVLVPFKIWLMVVFISGISFLGYILIKVVGTWNGVSLTGLLGGLASSTAVTLTFAQRSRDSPGLAKSFALAILLAWSVMFVRIMIETATVNPALFKIVWLPLVAGMVVTLIYCGYLYRSQKEKSAEQGENFTNPFHLKPAITFGVLYAIIILVANSARLYFGDTGVYLSSILSGLADVDAITLSMAELSRNGNIETELAARAVILAAASNTMVKGGIVLATGSTELRKVILPGVIAIVITAVGVAFMV